LKRPVRLALGCAIAVATYLDVCPAAGATAVPVALSFEGCAPSLASEVERIARIELHAGTENVGTAATEIALTCDGDDARITVDDPLTGKRVERTVSLAKVPQGRARLLALAIAELVRSSWLELDLNPEPALPVARPELISSEEKESARTLARPPPPWRGDLAVEGLFIPTVGRPLLGLSLGAQYDVARLVFVGGGMSAWDGVTERSTGAVTVRQIALEPAAGLRLSRVELALGIRLGWASLTGAPSESGFRGDTTSGVVLGPLVSASARIVGPLRLWLRSGWLLRNERGIVAGDRDVVVGGYWGSLGIGLRIGR
jgi:hypothetical protein